MLAAPVLANGTTESDWTGLGLALVYYENKQFQEAAKAFEREAELGTAAAQRNLGLMLAKGEGVEQNLSQAYLWFRAAAEQGDQQAVALADIALSKVPTDEADKLVARSGEFATQHAPLAARKALYPVIEDDAKPTYQSRPKTVSTVAPIFPAGSAHSRNFGFSLVVFETTADGLARDYRSIRTTHEDFYEASTRVLPKWRFGFEPNRAVQQMFRYTSASLTEDRVIESVMRDWEQQAESGSQQAAAILGVLLHTLTPKPTAADYARGTRLMADAAVHGVPLAMDSLATALNWGIGCTRDFDKARNWRHLAANFGVASARYELATLSKNSSKKRFWLEAASHSGNDNAKVLLAWTFAVDGASSENDIERAIKLLEQAQDTYQDKVAHAEAFAASYAAAANFHEARKWQKRAAKLRRRYDWPTQQSDWVMARYESNMALHLRTSSTPWSWSADDVLGK